jgi:hypothetical protein
MRAHPTMPSRPHHHFVACAKDAAGAMAMPVSFGLCLDANLSLQLKSQTADHPWGSRSMVLWASRSPGVPDSIAQIDSEDIACVEIKGEAPRAPIGLAFSETIVHQQSVISLRSPAAGSRVSVTLSPVVTVERPSVMASSPRPASPW